MKLRHWVLVLVLVIPDTTQAWTMAPDGSYVEGDSWTMAPDGSYVGE